MLRLKVMVIAIAILAVAAMVSISYAQGTIELPQTGQKTCYDVSGNVINCANTGQDGKWQAGVEWPYPRFTDNNDGTVTDNLTGLIWLKNANCFGQTDWANDLNSANNLANGQCGLTDGSQVGNWRLSNGKELRSLIDYSQYNPALPSGHPFSNVQSRFYWSSTTYAQNIGYAWSVSMAIGHATAYYKTYKFFVWPVRAGQDGSLYNMDISKDGSSRGTVKSDDGGINCGTDYSETYTSDANVTLTAVPDAGSTFAGWSGDCSSCGANITCAITMNADKLCTAIFKIKYSFDFLSPVTLEKPFKRGSTIPVKFILIDEYGNVIPNATASLTLQLYSDDTPSGDPIDATSNVPNSGNLFRFSDGQYIYNLSTNNLQIGRWLATVTLNDGTTHSIFIGIK